MKRSPEALEAEAVAVAEAVAMQVDLQGNFADDFAARQQSVDQGEISVAYQRLASLDLSDMKEDQVRRLLQKHTVRLLFDHLQSPLKAIQEDSFEALVSVCHTSEAAVMVLYANGMFPVLKKLLLESEPGTLPYNGALTALTAMCEVVGDVAAKQLAVADLTPLATAYCTLSVGRTRVLVAQLFEVLCEENELSFQLPVSKVSLQLKEETLAALTMLSARLGCQQAGQQEVTAASLAVIDAVRKLPEEDSTLASACQSKALELLSNCFCSEQTTIGRDRHLESVLADEVLRLLSPVQTATMPALNALNNYLMATGEASLVKDVVEQLVEALVGALMSLDEQLSEPVSGLLRALALTCDFTLSPEQEASLLKVTCEEALINLCPIMFHLKTPNAAPFIAHILKDPLISLPCLLEYVEGSVTYPTIDIDKHSLLEAVQRIKSNKAFSKAHLERISNLFV